MAWKIDPAHTEIEFSVKHMMITTVRGRFTRFDGTVTVDPNNLLRSGVEGSIEVASVDTDVLVLGDVREATDLVQDLCGTIPGVRGVYGGRLRNAHQVEALTANLISVNRRYRAHAGVRITDL